MASTRSDATAPGAGRSTARGQTRESVFLPLVRRGMRIQVAACTTAVTTFTRWAHSADRLAQAVADELLRRVDGERTAADVAAGVIAAGTTHFGELSALPRAAADDFDARLARVPIDS
jgi:hypothetical protein